MKSIPQAARGLLLRIEPHAEKFSRLVLLTAEFGLVTVLRRLPTKPGPALNPSPDLFDSAALQLDQPSASSQGLYFLREYSLLRRRPGTGQNWARLQAASSYAGLLARNAQHLDNFPALLAEAETVFDHLESSPHPDLVFFKALYRFLRDEGLPVRQSWWEDLPPPQQDAARLLLNQPIPPPGPPPDALEPLLASLLRWTRANTAILV